MRSASILLLAAGLLTVLALPAAAGGPAAVPAAMGPAAASQTALQPVLPGLYVPVRRCNDCQAVRTARWIRSLAGDRARVLDETGFPVFRYRESALGRVVEYWTYPSLHRTYVFEGDRLLRVQPY